MKLICEISVCNRLAPHIKSRSQQSTLALGYHPPNASKDAENLFLIHFTATNKNGTRYKVKRNIERVFTKFVQDGKTTLSLKQPPHDLLIRCEPIQLKAFLQTFKNALEGKLDPINSRLSTLAVTGVPKTSVPQKSLTILKPSDYPIHGLPKTLRTLHINGIRKYSIDSAILALNNLQILNMSKNAIEKLPPGLGDLRLVQLDLSANQLANTLSRDWDWLDRSPIKSTLQTLNLSNNAMTIFPYGLVRLRKLMVLILNGNRLQRVPFAIRRLKLLRTLNLADNQIKTLPNSFSRMTFETLDISGLDMFTPPYDNNSLMQPMQSAQRQPPKLWQFAAQIVISKNIRFGPCDLPTTVIDSLEEYPLCDCGKLCSSTATLFHRTCQLQLRTSNCIKSTALPIYGDSVYCSAHCQFIHQKFFIAH